jgi:hypothetical protein
MSRLDLAALGTADMVEFHHDWIAKSAIYAGMLLEVRVDEGTVSLTVTRQANTPPCVVRVPVFVMVSARIPASARTADRVLASRLLVAHAVLHFVSTFAASPTPLHSQSIQADGASSVAQPITAWRARRESNPHRSA